jgi:hypothetical protein
LTLTSIKGKAISKRMILILEALLKFLEVLNTGSLLDGQLKGCIVSLLLIKAHLKLILQLKKLALGPGKSMPHPEEPTNKVMVRQGVGVDVIAKILRLSGKIMVLQGGYRVATFDGVNS